jgi:hypothetical protein
MAQDFPCLTLTRHQQRLLDTSTAIRGAPPERIDFLHAIQCQCGIPYRNPGNGIHEWDRKQGIASLRLEAGSAIDPATGEFVKLGLPYGEKPRLVLIHLATEAVRTGSPVVDVEDSMTAFARSLGLETNGQQLRALKDQLARLAAARVLMGIVSLGQHAVPLDHRAVAALASSSMALDIYVWLAQRLHRVPSGRPQFLAWGALHEQFGQGFTRIRDFRRKFLQTLHQVQSAYPAARLDADDRGLTLTHSPPPVAPRPAPRLL